VEQLHGVPPKKFTDAVFRLLKAWFLRQKKQRIEIRREKLEERSLASLGMT